MTLKLYYDLLSQPARACYIFLNVNKIDFTKCPVSIMQRENRSEEYTAMNPFRKVPVIDDNGFVLTESNAILKYLVKKYKTPDHWFPTDFQKQMKIEEYLHWHHWNVRWSGSLFFLNSVLKPMLSGKVDAKKVELYRKQLDECTSLFESYFIGKTKFIASDEISFADIQALSEFMQPWAAGYDVFTNRPHLTAWRDRVKAKLQPYFDEAHTNLYHLAKTIAEQKADDQQAKL